MTLPLAMQTAIDALKRRDYAAARAALSGQPMASFAVPHFLAKGLAESMMSDWPAATATFAAACARFPTEPLLWLNLGVAQENLGQVDAAIESHERCLTLLPDQADAHGNLANLYRKKRRFAEAEAEARRALALGADPSAVYNSLGLALARQGKLDEAQDCYLRAAAANPDNADVALNRANLAVDRLEFDKAWSLFADLSRFPPKATYRRDEGLARLLAGDYAHGYELCEARLEIEGALRLHPSCPLWRGEDLTGKTLLIIAEQGFGDVIQFCRYQACLPADARLVWAVPRPLVRLLSGALRGEVRDEAAELPPCDVYLPILSLPLRAGHPAPLPTLPALSCSDTPRLPGGDAASRKIGLVWAGSPTHERDLDRSIPFADFQTVMQGVDASFYAPFTGAAAMCAEGTNIRCLDNLIGDFADTAALLKQLNLLICVDTAVAHLAASLNVPTILLLPYCPDWRWGVSGETTPWYPSMHLLRQTKPGDWREPLLRANDSLKRGFREPA